MRSSTCTLYLYDPSVHTVTYLSIKLSHSLLAGVLRLCVDEVRSVTCRGQRQTVCLVLCGFALKCVHSQRDTTCGHGGEIGHLGHEMMKYSGICLFSCGRIRLPVVFLLLTLARCWCQLAPTVFASSTPPTSPAPPPSPPRQPSPLHTFEKFMTHTENYIQIFPIYFLQFIRQSSKPILIGRFINPKCKQFSFNTLNEALLP